MGDELEIYKLKRDVEELRETVEKQQKAIAEHEKFRQNAMAYSKAVWLVTAMAIGAGGVISWAVSIWSKIKWGD